VISAFFVSILCFLIFGLLLKKNLTQNKQNVKEILALSRDFYQNTEKYSSGQAS